MGTTSVRPTDRYSRSRRPRQRAGWLVLALVFLVACTNSPSPNPAATQTRAVEQAELTAVSGTMAALTGRPLATPGTPTVARQTPQPTLTPTPARRSPTRAGVPAFTDLVVDEARSQLYGTDKLAGRVIVLGLPNLETVASIDVGQAAQPVGLALSPDGAELAVALFGAGNVALIDLATLQVTGKLFPQPRQGDSAHPWSVVFTKSGRLFVAGGGSSEPIYVFETASRSQIGRSNYPDDSGPQSKIVAADDGSLYASDNRGGSPENIVRFSPDESAPKQVARGPHGPVRVPDLAVRRDGTAVYTAGGQVWSSNLQSQLGAIAAVGICIHYVPTTERLFICQEKGVAEVEATGNYNVVATHPLSATARVARASADGKSIYVSTDAGMEVVKPGVSAQVQPSAVPKPSAASQPRGNQTATAVAGITPTKPGVPALFELALDEDRNRLYGTDKAAGKLLVFELPALIQIAAIDLGAASQPAGVALSPAGTEVAVALSGAGHIALIDPESLTIAGKLYPTVPMGSGIPWDVRYNPSGYLFSTGNTGLSGIEYIHVFDTKTRSEIGKSINVIRHTPRLAFSADGSIFVAIDGSAVLRLALDGNVPLEQARGPVGSVVAPDLAVRPDGTAVYTSGGQVWSGDLQNQLGAFNAKGSRIEYVPYTERLYICQESAVIEVEATGSYNVVKTHGVGTTARVARANAHGTMLYVSTDSGIVAIPLSAGASATPKP